MEGCRYAYHVLHGQPMHTHTCCCPQQENEPLWGLSEGMSVWENEPFLGLFEDYGAGSVYRHKQAFLTCSSVYWQPVSSGWALKELMPPSGNSGIRGMGGWGSHILRSTICTGTYLHQEGGVYICVKTSSIWRIRERALSELMLQTLTSMRKDGSTLYWSCRIPLRPSRSEDRRSSWSELQMRN